MLSGEATITNFLAFGLTRHVLALIWLKNGSFGVNQ
jgi:hypothetical protein